jgi:hypothetical protein
MFRFTQEPSSGSHNQCVAKISADVVSVMATLCRHNTDNVCTDTHSWTSYVILATHWLWLPDDGSYLNRHMLEQIL